MLAKFVENQLLNGFREGSFTEAQVTIWSLNYVDHGRLTQESVAKIQVELAKIKIELEEAKLLEEQRLEDERLEQERLEQDLLDQLAQQPVEINQPEKPGGD